MGLPRPPGGPITHPSARHQPLQTDPEATETTQPDHTPAATGTCKGSSSASGACVSPNQPESAAVRTGRSPPATASSTTSWTNHRPSCTPHVVAAGSGLVDSGGDVHVVRNEGSVDLVTVVVSLVPADAARRIDAPSPGTCPF
jgi:hypothetical protein